MNKRRPSNAVAARKRTAPRIGRDANPFPFEELGQKDLLSTLGLWAAIEIASFLILPAMMGIDFGTRLKTWFTLSIPFGFGGAFLLAMSSRMVAIANAKSSESRSLMKLLGQVGGIAGFLGVVFPFLMVAGEFLGRIFK